MSILAIDRTAFPDDGRHEPAPAAIPRRAALAGVLRLDPGRAGFDPAPPPDRGRRPWGPVGSLLLHLLPLLLIVDWPRTPVEVAAPIPIRLVIVQPPPPPAPRAGPTPAVKPPPGRRGSDNMEATAGPDSDRGRAGPAPAEAEPQAPPAAAAAAETRPAAAPKPVPEAPRAAETPRPAETRTVLVAPPLPPPAPVPLDPPVPVAALPLPPVPEPAAPPRPVPPRRREATPLIARLPLPLPSGRPGEMRHSARLTGPPTVRDEYCAEALSLTLRHIDLLPRAATAGRQGETMLKIVVLGDGTINGVRVARSSGYSDIDERIQRMVIAVGRFPPLPRWMGASMEFTFNLHFPHPLQR